MTPDSPIAMTVAQIGARMHYAVPEILERNGLLHQFHTDIVAPKTSLMGVLGNSPLVRRFRGRVITDAVRARTVQYPGLGLWHGLSLKRAKTPHARTAVFLAQAQSFGRKVARADWSGTSAVYGFTTASYEILSQARTLGVHGFLEQYIAAQPLRDRLLAEDRARFADWEAPQDPGAENAAFTDRLRAEWDLADTILCPSPFVADSLVAEGVAADKLQVVPYGVPLPPRADRAPRDPGGRLRILFVGSVELRKGIHYLAEALGQLPKGAYEARIVGSLRLSETGRARLSEVADIVGRVPRAEMADQFAWADLFVLPSLVEGSATVTYEALSHGVPVLCTPNTGSIIEDDKTGLIVEPFAAAPIAEALTRLLDDPALLARLTENAHGTRESASMERYERDLLGAIRGRLGTPSTL